MNLLRERRRGVQWFIGWFNILVVVLWLGCLT